MKCQILFSGKNKKNISKCRLLKILPRVLSVKSATEFPYQPGETHLDSYIRSAAALTTGRYTLHLITCPNYFYCRGLAIY